MADGYAGPGPGRPARPVVYVDTEFGIPMIGVAKTGFGTATHAIPILQGPPRAGVTAAGMRRGRRGGASAAHGRAGPAT
jgi:hypothetical protein